MRDFHGKYAASLMGVFWSVMNPLLLLGVFTFVFTAIFRIRLGSEPGFANNALYIFCGVLPWIAFQESAQRSVTSLIEHKNLVTRVRFPSVVIPASIVGSSFLGMLIGLAVLVAALALKNGTIPPTALLLPVLIIFQIIFALGVCWFVSSVNIFFRDLQQLVPVGLLVWMYGTPIFYSPDMVPDTIDMGGHSIHRVHLLLMMNPLHHFIAAYRSILLDGVMPNSGNITFIALFSGISFVFGLMVFNRGSKKFADAL